MHAVKSPPSDPPLHDWVVDNLPSLEAAFDRFDFLKLKHRGLLGMRQVLERSGMIEELESDYVPIDFSETHCRQCGRELFWALPGKTTREEIVGYAELIGDEQIKADQWIHPGVYCPKGCTFVMYNIRPSLSGDECVSEHQDDGEPIEG